MCYTINLNYYKAYNEKTRVLCSSAAITFSCFFFTFIILNDMLTFLIFSLLVLDMYCVPTMKNESLALILLFSYIFYPFTHTLSANFLLKSEGVTLYPVKYSSHPQDIQYHIFVKSILCLPYT